MEAFSDAFSFIAGAPAIIGLLLAAAVIFLTSDRRLSLGALLVQYTLVGITLTRFVQAEVAIIKFLVGVLAVAILYLSAQRIQDTSDSQEAAADSVQFLGLQWGWSSGPLGLPLRILTFIMVAMAAIYFFDDYRSLLPVAASDSSTAHADVAFVSLWLAAMGVIGLAVSGDPLRVAPAVLTILTAFDLVYVLMEPNLAIIGFVAALTLMAALAFAYLITVQSLMQRIIQEGTQAQAPSAAPSVVVLGSEEGKR